MSKPQPGFCEIDCASPDATRNLARTIARHLWPGAVVTLQGTLGAGKTFLVQSIAESLGIDRRRVTSPTFALIQQYTGRLDLVHIDAYRISDEDEFVALGIDEYFNGDSVVLIEWAEKFADCLPEDRLAISITVLDEQRRTFRISWPQDSARSVEAGRAVCGELASGPG